MNTIGKRVAIDENGCWVWQAAHTKGYGRVLLHGAGVVVYAHRASYGFFVGAVPEGMELDHLCCNTSCVNPEHLEPVTRFENYRRHLERSGMAEYSGDTCVNGHPWTEETTRIYTYPATAKVHAGKTIRTCRECGLSSERRQRAKKADEAKAAQRAARVAAIHAAAEDSSIFGAAFFSEPTTITDPDMRVAAIVRHTLGEVNS